MSSAVMGVPMEIILQLGQTVHQCGHSVNKFIKTQKLTYILHLQKFLIHTLKLRG